MVRYLLLYRWPILLASLCSLLLGFLSASLVTVLGPALKLLLDGDFSTPKPAQELFGSALADKLLLLDPSLAVASQEQWMSLLPLLLFIFAACKSSVQFCSWYLWEWLAEGVSSSLRKDLVSSYLHLNPIKRELVKEEDFSTLVTTDCKLLREYIVHFYGGFPREILQIVFMLATQFMLSPKLTAIFMVLVVPIVLLITTFGRRIKKRADKALKDYSILTEWLQQRLLGLETIKHYQTEPFELATMQDKSTSLFQKLLRAAKIKATTAPVIQFLAVTCMLFALYVAFEDIAKGTLSGSLALSFFSSLALLAQSVGNCGRYFNSNRESKAAMDRISNYLKNLKENSRSTVPLKTHKDETVALLCDKVCVTYDGSKNVLNHFSYSFKPNTFYVLTGPSGVGKTTLFKSILSLIPLKSGTISLAEKLTLGYVPQQTDLLRGTIAQQVAYPDQNYDEDKIRDALSLVDLSGFVSSLPLGLNTVLGEEGRDFSGGQKQRLALARVFYHDYKLLLIDEGSSALDPLSEVVFYESLKKQAANKTILFIAHRTKVLDYADEVLQFPILAK